MPETKSSSENFEDWKQRLEDEQFMGESIRDWIQWIREAAADSDDFDLSDSNTEPKEKASEQVNEKKTKNRIHA